MAKKLIYFIAGTFAIFSLFVLGFSYYLSTHEDLISDEIKDLANANLNGKFDFDDLDITFFSTFPEFSFHLTHVTLAAPDSLEQKINLIELKNAYLKVSFRELLSQKILIKGIMLNDGQLYVFKDKNGRSSLDIFKKAEKNEEKKTAILHRSQSIDIKINDLGVIVEDLIKNRKLSFKMKQLESEIIQKNDTLFVFDTNLDAQIDSLGFNLNDGVFLKNTPVSGKFKGSWDKQLIKVFPFDLQVGSQTFKADIGFETYKEGLFTLNFENPQTQWKPSMLLLNTNVRDLLSPLKVEGPIHTNVKVQGKFLQDFNPLISVHFGLNNNNAVLGDSLDITGITTQGFWMNRLNPADPTYVESRQDMILMFDELKVEVKSVQLNTTNAWVKQNQIAPKKVNFDFRLAGNNKDLNELLGNQQFLFRAGKWQGSLQFKGQVNDLEKEFLGLMYGKFRFMNNKIYYVPNKVNLMIKDLAFEISKDELLLRNMDVQLASGIFLKFDGVLKNFYPLVYNRSTTHVRSHVNLKSSKVSWEAIRGYVEDNQQVEKKNAGIGQLKAIVSELNQKFHPSLNIAIDEFQYRSFVAKNIRTALAFENNKHLSLRNAGFSFQQGKVNADVDFDWNKPQTTYISTKFSAKHFDAAAFTKSFDFFGINSLREAKKITGILNLDAQLSGIDHDVSGFDMPALNGKIHYGLSNLELIEFEPVVKIGGLIFRKERVNNVKIRDMENTLLVKNLTINFPNTAFESTTLNFFFEGKYDYNNKSNMLIVVPWANLNRRELNEIPNMDTSGNNIYIHAIEDKYGRMNYLLKLKDKRDEPKFQEKIEKKIERSEKKYERKQQRKNKEKE